eukprot:6002677-Prorocentrum_lima.AAC.1
MGDPGNRGTWAVRWVKESPFFRRDIAVTPGENHGEREPYFTFAARLGASRASPSFNIYFLSCPAQLAAWAHVKNK